MLHQFWDPLTLGPRQVSGQCSEDAPVSVGSLHPAPPPPKIHNPFLLGLANTCQASSIVQTPGNAELVLVRALQEHEAITAPGQTGAWNFLLLAAQTSVQFATVSCCSGACWV